MKTDYYGNILNLVTTGKCIKERLGVLARIEKELEDNKQYRIVIREFIPGTNMDIIITNDSSNDNGGI